MIGFNLFWKKVEQERQSVDVVEPQLPRGLDDGQVMGIFLVIQRHSIDNSQRRSVTINYS